jgi:hypothetical protein
MAETSGLTFTAFHFRHQSIEPPRRQVSSDADVQSPRPKRLDDLASDLEGICPATQVKGTILTATQHNLRPTISHG